MLYSLQFPLFFHITMQRFLSFIYLFPLKTAESTKNPLEKIQVDHASHFRLRAKYMHFIKQLLCEKA